MWLTNIRVIQSFFESWEGGPQGIRKLKKGRKEREGRKNGGREGRKEGGREGGKRELREGWREGEGEGRTDGGKEGWSKERG